MRGPTILPYLFVCPRFPLLYDVSLLFLFARSARWIPLPRVQPSQLYNNSGIRFLPLDMFVYPHGLQSLHSPDCLTYPLRSLAVINASLVVQRGTPQR